MIAAMLVAIRYPPPNIIPPRNNSPVTPSGFFQNDFGFAVLNDSNSDIIGVFNIGLQKLMKRLGQLRSKMINIRFDSIGNRRECFTKSLAGFFDFQAGCLSFSVDSIQLLFQFF